ncbi:MAG: hypothetical protein K9M82_11190 [Deltaproteobacteria bacterium]|nr:hypothetical protein [Deltaproteobacteria bacterium]
MGEESAEVAFPVPGTAGFLSSRMGTSLGELLRFDLMLLAFLILGTRLATVLHELAGHALTVLISGGWVNAVHISLLGGGRVLHELPDGAGTPARFLVACSGIAVNLLTGFLVLHRFRGTPRKRLLDGLWILFAGASLLGGAAYAALGLYYGQGDPVAWMDRRPDGASWACIPFLMAAPFLGFAAVKRFSAWIGQWFPSRSLAGRMLVLAVTAGAAVGAYTGLYQATGARSRALDAPQAAYTEAKRRIVQARREDLAQHLRDSRPDLTEDRVRQLVERTPVEVRPEEIPRKLPLKLILALLFGAGGLAALHRGTHAPATGGRVPTGFPFLAALLAAGIIAVLLTTGGWIYRSPGLLP